MPTTAMDSGQAVMHYDIMWPVGIPIQFFKGHWQCLTHPCCLQVKCVLLRLCMWTVEKSSFRRISDIGHYRTVTWVLSSVLISSVINTVNKPCLALTHSLLSEITDILQTTFTDEFPLERERGIVIRISLQSCVRVMPTSLPHVMAWHLICDVQLPEQCWPGSLTHIYATRPHCHLKGFGTLSLANWKEE